jgi:hypothetical protein
MSIFLAFIVLIMCSIIKIIGVNIKIFSFDKNIVKFIGTPQFCKYDEKYNDIIGGTHNDKTI